MTYVPLRDAIIGAACFCVWCFWLGVMVGLWKCDAEDKD